MEDGRLVGTVNLMDREMHIPNSRIDKRPAQMIGEMEAEKPHGKAAAHSDSKFPALASC